MELQTQKRLQSLFNCSMLDHLFSKHYFCMYLFLSLRCIRIFQHIVIFRKGNISSDKLRSCFYKWRYVWLKRCFC